MIQLKKIEQDHLLKCPNCGHARLAATFNTLEVPGGGYFLSDGDTIFGLYEDLIEAGLITKPKDGENHNFDYALLVGDCTSCESEYYALQVSMIDDSVVVDEEFVHGYFYEARPIPASTNYVATLAEPDMQWLVQRHDTNKGVCLTHMFGPFDLGGKTMKGVFGVAACSSGDLDTWEQGRKFLFQLWPQLKALAVEVNQPQA
ncbi:hypothetical protein N5E86_21640 [Stutzerimonas stutzeri]|jgi:hypothetical protein|uniref:hypothetical protein n=1 Tax=Stutzerimonas stutzeri TaxID=316 RepID=UPI00244D2C89|nr:hypothetical protein [Stutzerimonas stutzeri]MDH1557057.1 hypothetical protein [Stutzerimonas stutzeri]